MGRIILYTKAARKGLLECERVSPKHAAKLYRAFDDVAEAPTLQSLMQYDVKAMQGTPAYRLRVGSWRAVFEIDPATLTVLVIALRKDVYR